MHDDVLVNGISFVAIDEVNIEAYRDKHNPFVKLSVIMQYNDSAVSIGGVGIVSGRTGDVLGSGVSQVIGA